MERKEFLELIKDLGQDLLAASFDNDPYQSPEDMAQDRALAVVGDLIRDWAETKLSESSCPYTQSHTRHWCGYRECRDS